MEPRRRPARRDQPAVMKPGVSSRRSACDRCRGQKLRCLREAEDAEGPCNRCAKADAHCVTSPIYHMRNMFARYDADAASSDLSAPPSSPRKRCRQHDHYQARASEQGQSSSRGSRAPETSPTVSTSATPASGSFNSFSPPERFREFTGDESGGVSGGATTAGDRVAGSTYSGWTSTPVPPPASTATTTSLSADAHSWDAASLGLDSLFPANGSGFFVQSRADDGAGRAASQKSQQPDVLAGNSETQHGIADPANKPPRSLPYQQDDLGLSAFENYSLIDLVAPGNEADTKTYNVIGELSTINGKLAAQMKQMVQGGPIVTLKTLIAPECNSSQESTPVRTATATTPLENIINTTRQYLHVLTRVQPPTRSWPSSLSHVNSRTETSSDSASTVLSTSSAPDDSDASLASTPGTTLQSSLGAPGDAKPDPTTQMQALICYIYVLRLHVAVFAHIREYIQMISESDDPTINPLPGLCGTGDISFRMF